MDPLRNISMVFSCTIFVGRHNSIRSSLTTLIVSAVLFKRSSLSGQGVESSPSVTRLSTGIYKNTYWSGWGHGRGSVSMFSIELRSNDLVTWKINLNGYCPANLALEFISSSSNGLSCSNFYTIASVGILSCKCLHMIWSPGLRMRRLTKYRKLSLL